ncbi:MAG: DUF2490 domain-containing protein [Bacteroidia bacterium]|nr:DUF2490 domain-containing protein [Bacteroidia bacterium]
MDRRGLIQTLTRIPILFLSAQSPSLSSGSWTVQQVMVPLGRGWLFQFNTQPRFVPLVPKAMDMLVVSGFFWREVNRHRWAVGGNHAWVQYPRSFHQWRALIRWQWTLTPRIQTQLSLEQRWQAGRSVERLLRPQLRYRIPLGPLWVGTMDEGLFYGWNPTRGWHIALRQNRYWIFATFPRQAKWEIEVGYLNLAAPAIPPRHRLWLAIRLRPELFSSRRTPGTDTADPANEVQSLPLGSHVGFPPP